MLSFFLFLCFQKTIYICKALLHMQKFDPQCKIPMKRTCDPVHFHTISRFLQFFAKCLTFIPKRIELSGKYQCIRHISEIFLQDRRKIRILSVFRAALIKLQIIFHLLCCEKITGPVCFYGFKRRFFCITVVQCRIDQDLFFRIKFSPVSGHHAHSRSQISAGTAPEGAALTLVTLTLALRP